MFAGSCLVKSFDNWEHCWRLLAIEVQLLQHMPNIQLYPCIGVLVSSAEKQRMTPVPVAKFACTNPAQPLVVSVVCSHRGLLPCAGVFLPEAKSCRFWSATKCPVLTSLSTRKEEVHQSPAGWQGTLLSCVLPACVCQSLTYHVDKLLWLWTSRSETVGDQCVRLRKFALGFDESCLTSKFGDMQMLLAATFLQATYNALASTSKLFSWHNFRKSTCHKRLHLGFLRHPHLAFWNFPQAKKCNMSLTITNPADLYDSL